MAWNPIIKLAEEDYHRDFLREAYKFAAENSPDPSTKTGAVIVRVSNAEILAYGTNHLPRGVTATKEQLADRKWKYEHIIHAETSAIFDAARNGKQTLRRTMYMPWVPCTPCAYAIIDAGLNELVGHKAMIMKTPERWQDSTDYALKLLNDAGVRLRMYDGEIGDVEGLFNGILWKP
jgi:dCMP deaminase